MFVEQVLDGLDVVETSTNVIDRIAFCVFRVQLDLFGEEKFLDAFMIAECQSGHQRRVQIFVLRSHCRLVKMNRDLFFGYF